jgi:hypothetical protein
MKDEVRMMKKILILAAGGLFCMGVSHAANEPALAHDESTKLLNAIVANDYPLFVGDGDAAFRELKKSQFDAVVSQLNSKLKAGYELAYLGELNQRGSQVTLWRIRFKPGGDDLLATLSMRDGKVDGYWIK